MEKKYSYHSRKALGVIYDKVINKSFQFNPVWGNPFDQRIIKHKTLTPGSDMLDAARQIKSQYDVSVRRILNQHDLKTEFELWTGFAMSKGPIGSDYKRQEELGREYDALKHRFRDMCYGAAGGKHTGLIDCFVVAMYTVTEEETKAALSELNQESIEDTNDALQPDELESKAMPLISFPWIFHWVLIRLVGSDSTKESSQVAAGQGRHQPLQPLGDKQSDSVRADHKAGAVEAARTDLGAKDHANLPDGTVIERGQPLTLFDLPEATSPRSPSFDTDEGKASMRQSQQPGLDRNGGNDDGSGGEVNAAARETGCDAAQEESAMDRLARLVDCGGE